MECLHQFTQTITLSDMAALRQELAQVLTAGGVNSEAMAEMILAINEAVTNSLHHCYQTQAGWVQIEIWRDGHSLLVKQYDAAPPFDPTTVPTPDTSLPLTLRPLGGMGVHMMRSFTDELRYERTADGRNLLTLIKYDAFDK